MPCYHPLLRVLIPGNRTVNGKPDGRIYPFPPDLRPGIDPHVYLPNQLDSKCWAPCGSDKGLPYQVIPCGKCLGCRMEYSRQWANRCMLELEYHECAYFVTLTYDDLHVPSSFYPDPETGEAQPSMTLCPRDVQLFLKRLRFYFPGERIRFFMCGEYGPSTWRPHYHLILFGLPLTDLVYKGTRRGNNYYVSRVLERAWSVECSPEISRFYDSSYVFEDERHHRLYVPQGFVEVGEVTWETCAYTARYIMKKLKGPEAQFYNDFALYPPFVRMSRQPGLARQWYEDHPGMNEYEYINIKTPAGGKKFRPPRYYHKLYDIEYPEESARLKEIRQRLTMESIKAKLQRTDLSYLDYLSVEEDKLKRRTASLKREEI